MIEIKEVKKLPSMRPRAGNLEREKKISWLRQLRERIQHLSIAFRPQMVRTMWMRRTGKTDARVLVEERS